jgi:putative addiction module CopG family antidote
MDVTIPAQYEKVVRERIASGQYKTEADVVAEGLRLLDAQYREAHIDTLREYLKSAVEHADKGEYASGDKESLKQEARRTFDQRHGH